jgi:hypothetical protein
MPTNITSPIAQEAIKDAQTGAELIKNLEAVDPALAQSLIPKGLLAARTPYVQVLVTIISAISVKYAIGLDDQTEQIIACAIVAGATWVSSLIMRYITRQPIAGVVTASKP